MSDGTLTLTASAKFSALENELARSKESVRKLETQVSKLKSGMSAVEKKGKDTGVSFEQMATRAVASYVSIQAAINLVNNALQQQIALQQAAREHNTTVAQAERIIGTMTPDFTTEQRNRLLRGLEKISAETGVDEAQLKLQASRPISATSGFADDRVDKVLQVAESLAPMFLGNMDEAGAVMSSVLDAQKSLGMAIEDTANFLLNASSQSRIDSVENLPNLIRAIAAGGIILNADDKLGTAKDIVALTTAFQSLAGDGTGAISSTGVTNFLATLVEYSEKQNVAMMDIIAELRNDPNKLADVMDHVLGKSFIKPMQRNMLSGGLVHDTFTENRKALDVLSPDAIKNVQEFTRAGTPAIIQDTMLRKNEVAARMLQRDVAYVDVIRQRLYGPQGALTTAERTSAIGTIAKRLEQMRFEANVFTGVDPIAQAEFYTKTNLQMYRDRQTFFSPRGLGTSMFWDQEKAKEGEQLMRGVLKDLEVLKQQREASKPQNKPDWIDAIGGYGAGVLTPVLMAIDGVKSIVGMATNASAAETQARIQHERN